MLECTVHRKEVQPVDTSLKQHVELMSEVCLWVIAAVNR